MKAQKLIPLLVVAAGLLAYQNSFTGAFVYDDLRSIHENPTIRHLWPVWRCLSPPHRHGITVEGRPLINLSLAVNYALGGSTVWGYHVLNLSVHILAGLTLLGLVRRTLLQPRLRARFGGAASELALATAVLWTVHPLQTESVTYVIQRAESIMGLFYLLTLYCFIRGAESPLVARSTRDEPRTGLWYGLSIVACVLGMASKEVMVSAPLMVMLYDRTFLSGSFREAWRRRWRLYLGLAATWLLLGYLAIQTFGNALTNAQRLDLHRWPYLATQPGVILYYLRLCVWPQPLCFDYFGWAVGRTWTSLLPPALAMAVLLGASAWAWKGNSAWGFLTAWLFLILAPSSSVIPLDSPVYEHRMYLPLVAVVVAVVLGIHALAGRRSAAVFIVVAIGFAFLTWRRNCDYRSGLALWQDTVAKRPNNPRAHCGVGAALWQAGRAQEATWHWEQALRLKPDYAEAHCSLGVMLGGAGRIQEAIKHLEQAVRIKPDFAEAHYNLGGALEQAGQLEAAVTQYEETLRFNPDYTQARDRLAQMREVR